MKVLWHKLKSAFGLGRKADNKSASSAVKNHKKGKVYETGRSMLEMLGVLTIMAVLTIGGISGYRYALDLIMAHQIVSGVRARSVIVGQQRVLEKKLDLREFHEGKEKDLIFNRFEVLPFNDFPRDFAFDADSVEWDIKNNYFKNKDNLQAMEVVDIPYRVCKILKTSDFVDPTYNFINGEMVSEYELFHRNRAEDDKLCIEDGKDRFGALITVADGRFNNVATFVFMNPCEKDEDCDSGESCCRGYCRSFCPCTHDDECDPLLTGCATCNMDDGTCSYHSGPCPTGCCCSDGKSCTEKCCETPDDCEAAGGRWVLRKKVK